MEPALNETATEQLQKAYQLIVIDLRSTWVCHEPPRCCTNCCHTNVTSDHHVAEEQPAADQCLFRTPGWSAHHIEIRWIESQCSCWQAIRHQVHPQQLDRYQSLRHAERCSQEDGHHLANIWWDQISNELLHVIVDCSAFLDSCHNRWKVVVGKDHFRGRLSNRCARTHCNANLGFLQCWSIVHTITSLCTQYMKIIHQRRIQQHMNTACITF